MDKIILEIVQKEFLIPKIKTIKPITAGNINSTYRVECNGSNYILQKINKNVFKKPKEVIQNIKSVSRYLKKKVLEEEGDPAREVLQLVDTLHGTGFIEDWKGEYWRMYDWIEGAKTYDYIDNPETFEKVGRAFGRFQKRLADFPTGNLYKAIPDFHNTPKRFSDFKHAILLDKAGRLAAIEGQEEHPLKIAINKVLAAEDEIGLLEDRKASGELPIRVTHNDTKISNVMIDENTGETICIIDLDTVGPDTALVDFGDAIRSGANPAGEEPENIEDAHIDLELFEAYTIGYLEETLVINEEGKLNTDSKKGLIDNEIKLLHKAPRILTLELVMRFIGDYLNGDEYFKLKEGQPEDLNLRRGLVQLHLAEDMNTKEDKMKSMVNFIARAIIDKGLEDRKIIISEV